MQASHAIAHASATTPVKEAMVFSQGDATEAFDLIEEPLNEVTLLVVFLVDCFGAASRWVLLDLCGRAQIVRNEGAQTVGVVARIGDDMADPLQPLDQ